MNFDDKMRIGLLLVSVALSAVVALAAAHGIFLGPLDGIGGTGH
jgi:hypothetical protein